VYNILLQVFEDGQLTDGLGNTVDFRNTILIMDLEPRRAASPETLHPGIPVRRRRLGRRKSLDELVLSEVKRVFNPEFLNRLD